jgi:hypothetical protein
MLPDDDMRYAIETCRSSCFSVNNFRLIYDTQLVHLLVCNTQWIPRFTLCVRNTNQKSLKLHLLQSIPLVQVYISVSNCQGVGNIPGSYFMKAFSALPSHS